MDSYYDYSLSRGSNRMILLGCIYFLLGAMALTFASAITFAAVITLGIILAVAGIAQITYGLMGRRQGQLWPHLAFGCLALICGALIFMNPGANAFALTLVAGFWLCASGLAKMIGSATERAKGWGWFFANGLVSLILGGLVLGNLPFSAFWVVGVFIGADLIVTGCAQIGLGISVKRARRLLNEEYSPSLHPEPSYRERENRDQHPPF